MNPSIPTTMMIGSAGETNSRLDASLCPPSLVKARNGDHFKTFSTQIKQSHWYLFLQTGIKSLQHSVTKSRGKRTNNPLARSRASTNQKGVTLDLPSPATSASNDDAIALFEELPGRSGDLASERLFTSFPQFPWEIRDLIWLHALPKRRHLELPTEKSWKVINNQSIDTIPTIISACRESRLVAQKYYQLIYQPPNIPELSDVATSKFWVTPVLDTFYVLSPIGCNLYSGMFERNPTFMCAIRSVEIRGFHWYPNCVMTNYPNYIMPLMKYLSSLEELHIVCGSLARTAERDTKFEDWCSGMLGTELSTPGPGSAKDFVDLLKLQFVELKERDPERTIPRIIFHTFTPMILRMRIRLETPLESEISAGVEFL